MQLPGRLKDTTLGDVLGTLYRARATGTLELIDIQGHTHRIVLCEGNIETVASHFGPRLGELLASSLPEDAFDDAPEQRLGEALLNRGMVTRAQVGGALRTQNLARLERLFSLEDAAIRFRVPRPSTSDPTAPSPLSNTEYLKGRPRYRGRDEAPRATAPLASHKGALEILGLPPNATSRDVRQAFRTLAAQYHPDRHPEASAVLRVRLMRRFAEISSAYHELCG